MMPMVGHPQMWDVVVDGRQLSHFKRTTRIPSSVWWPRVAGTRFEGVPVQSSSDVAAVNARCDIKEW